MIAILILMVLIFSGCAKPKQKHEPITLPPQSINEPIQAPAPETIEQPKESTPNTNTDCNGKRKLTLPRPMFPKINDKLPNTLRRKDGSGNE